MVETVELIILNERREILLMLRDNKPDLPFANTWDLFGGHIEAGETPEAALVREIQEELAWNPASYSFFKTYEFPTGDVHPVRKYVYSAGLDVPFESLVLGEGQRMQFFTRREVEPISFANVNKQIVFDFFDSYENP